ncbi:T9SS type A sorting domain-containing protein [Hymenobacter cellulosilyticus]|uniref:T9SS type A sorting domain-containing protein n=1 Tax=Hymenobacter cellulosilyticus TaxID=2932248 RepID=A0A8T9Q7T0_9BACT|nr:T9SS type A sorting domain-containing protein [Hymenobacter cellulosilyticus]UOQ72118.1 T9SS type A sorting domain-containing protein [Hymenobacter cellulosilyticus]
MLWADKANGATTDDLSTGLGLATDKDGNAFVTGAVVGRITFGNLPATTGDLGAIVAKLSAGGTVASTRTAPVASKLSVFPNPASGSATLTLPAGGGRLVLSDALGRTVREQQLPAVAGACPVSLEGLTPGVYQLRATLANGEVAHAALSVR